MQVQERLKVREDCFKITVALQMANARHTIPSPLQSVKPPIQYCYSVQLDQPWAYISVLGLRLAMEQGTVQEILGIEAQRASGIWPNGTVNDEIGIHG